MSAAWGAVMAVGVGVLCAACARGESAAEDGYVTEPGADASADMTVEDVSHDDADSSAADGPADSPVLEDGLAEAPPDTADEVPVDAADESAADAPQDSPEDAGPDAPADGPEDAVTDGPPPSCNGTLLGGACWYLGAEEDSCTHACSSHGGYSDATRTYAGSAGTNAHCDEVLDSLGVPFAGGTTTLGGSGAGIGCAYMTLGSSRYRVADTATVANATYLLCRRACACAQ